MTRAFPLVLLAVPACLDYPSEVAPYGDRDNSSSQPDTTPPEQVVTWYRDVLPIFASRCQRCHQQDGVAPMPLDTHAMVVAYRDPIGVKLESDEMPPWPFAACRELTASRDLAPEELATFKLWASLDAPEGDLADYVAPVDPPPFAAASAVSVTLSGEPYRPVADSDGDARCFLLTPSASPGATGWWVTDFRIEPAATRIVQQATLYLVADPAAVIGGGAADYACPNSAGNDDAAAVAAWVPGAAPTTYPQGSALFVPPGARFVLRVRYLTRRLSGDIPSDRSGATLWHYEGVRTPTRQVRVNTLRATGRAAVAAHLPHSGTVFATIAELGQLGVLLRAEYGPGSDPDCLASVRIPTQPATLLGEWAETLYYAAPLETRLGEGRTNILCEHDGGGSDPICRLHLLATVPLYESVQAPESVCNGVDTCLAECTGAFCLLDCIAWEHPACGECAAAQLFGECRETLAPSERGLIDNCLAKCPADLGMAAWTGCALDDCAADLPIISQTLGNQVTSGRCNRPDASCVFHPAPP